MGTENSSVIPVKKPTLTPKAVVYQKFGSKAIYVIEKVEVPVRDECPVLAIAQNRPSLFRCQLQLPDITVVSDPFTRKKDAEQAAAQMALERLGIDINGTNSTTVDATDELISRLSYLFSNQFLASNHPLSSHMKATLRRERELIGVVSTSVLLALDPKLNNLCKAINPVVEIYPFLGLCIIGRFASSLPDLLLISEDMLCVRRKVPYAVEHKEATCVLNLGSTESKRVNATLIPYLSDEPVQPLSIDVCSGGYYLDVIAVALGVGDASQVLISRSIGKASSEMRLYFSASEKYNYDSALKYQCPEDSLGLDGPFNVRASFLSGQDVYGNAILASIGYTWKSPDLFHEDVSLSTYFRLLIGRTPNGLFKLSREALLLADLPGDFTSRANWRGLLPRDLLCSFCRQHRLCEPVFSVAVGASDLESAIESAPSGTISAVANSHRDDVELERSFRCEVRLFSKLQDAILEYVPKRAFKNKSEAVQHGALIVLSWLNRYLGQLDKSSANLLNHGDSVNIQCHEAKFLKEFYLFNLARKIIMKQTGSNNEGFLFLNHSVQQKIVSGYEFDHLDTGGSEFGSSPSIGSMVCISYSVSLVTEGKVEKDPLESNSEYEFEMGSGAVIPSVESATSQMVVGQTIDFNVELPPWEFILATAVDSLKISSTLSREACLLKYTVTLLKISEPLEDRMEQALFSPPLSKQRVAFAVQHIMETTATSLVDFGCGSGSLLDALVDCPNTLEMVFGVDISQKGLIRAAKVLHSKLVKAEGKSMLGLKSVILYEGSITTFDPRLYGFDIGTCLEVIEHMEEEQAHLFGDTVLGSFCPKILIISTPNYEYNVILQKSHLEKPTETGADDSSETPSCKFRNHDHKFEWTREQFCRWASDLALRHSYTVEFGGVGGSGEDPGFASQIAVFRREFHLDDRLAQAEHSYEVIWEWNASPEQ